MQPGTTPVSTQEPTQVCSQYVPCKYTVSTQVCTSVTQYNKYIAWYIPGKYR